MPPAAADDEPTEGFTVRDRRRVTADDTAPASAPDTPPAAQPTPTAQNAPAAPAPPGADLPDDEAAMHALLAGMSEEELRQVAAAMEDDEADASSSLFSPMGTGEGESAEAQESGELPDIYSVLALFLGELRNLAWLRMGLVANPGTGKIERDLAQAKVAIDTVAFLAQQMEPVVAPQERLPLRALVSDLQINFVEQSKRG